MPEVMSEDEIMQSRIDDIAARIKAVVPDADPSLYGDPWSGFGGATWAPARDPSTDYSQWGTWEVWEQCRIGRVSEMAVGPIATGAWVAWDTTTNTLSVGTRPDLPSKRQAELMAAMGNNGKPTRVVYKDGTAEMSVVDADEARRWAQRQGVG